MKNCLVSRIFINPAITSRATVFDMHEATNQRIMVLGRHPFNKYSRIHIAKRRVANREDFVLTRLTEAVLYEYSQIPHQKDINTVLIIL